MRVIGLTGGIGCGKSTVAARLAALGATVLDADVVGHQIYLPGKPAWDEVVAAFGRDVVAADGSIDRKALGAKVFADPAALARLNAIVHPRIAAEIAERIAALRHEAPHRPIVVEAAVMLEAGWDSLVDEIWVVTVPVEAAIARLVRSRNLSPEDAARRIAAQLSDDERVRRADVVLVNDGSLDALERRAGELYVARTAA